MTLGDPPYYWWYFGTNNYLQQQPWWNSTQIQPWIYQPPVYDYLHPRQTSLSEEQEFLRRQWHDDHQVYTMKDIDEFKPIEYYAPSFEEERAPEFSFYE